MWTGSYTEIGEEEEDSMTTEVEEDATDMLADKNIEVINLGQPFKQSSTLSLRYTRRRISRNYVTLVVQTFLLALVQMLQQQKNTGE